MPPRIQQLRLWALSHPKLAARGEDFWADELQAMYTTRKTRPQPLGDTPFAVLIGGKEADAPPGVAADDWKRLAAEKREQKVGLADLSRNSKVVIDPKSGNGNMLYLPLDKILDRIASASGEAAELVEWSRRG